MSNAVLVETAGFTTPQSSGSPVAARFPRPLLIILLVVAALAAVRVAAGVAMLMDPGGREWGEGLTLDHARRIVRGEPLYQPFGTSFLAIAGYTPLYYYALALIETLIGPGLGYLPGRLLGVLATAFCAAVVWRATQRRTGDWRMGALGGLLLVALGMPSAPEHPQLALQKEAVPALAFALAAFAAVDVGRIGMRHVILAAIFASLAILTKQTMAFAALPVGVYLWHSGWRLAIGYFALVGAMAGGVCVAFELLQGNFLAGTVGSTVNPFRLQVLVGFAPVVLVLMGGVVAASGIVVAQLATARLRSLRDPWVYGWLAGLALLLSTLPKLGTNPSHWLLLGAASSVLAPVALWRYFVSEETRGTRAGRVAVALVMLNLALAVPFAFQTASAAKAAVRPSPTYHSELAELVALVRAEPKDVLADPQDIPPLAGRAIITEPWAMSLAFHERLIGWQLEPVVDAVCSGRFGMLVLDYDLSTGGPYESIPRWPPAIHAALEASMVFEKRLANRYVYRWSKPCTT